MAGKKTTDKDAIITTVSDSSQEKSYNDRQIRESSTDFPVVGIGAPAGGLHVLKSFFSHMPEQPNMAFVIVQHLNPDHESFMVELLKKSTEMNIYQAKNNMPVEINSVYMIPPNAYMTIEQGSLRLFKPEVQRGFRTPIDHFFTSLAEDVEQQAICIILSGTGSDGSQGLRAVKEHNGIVFVQDPETAEYDGMPRNAINTNLVDFILPVEDMPEELLKVATHYLNRSISEITDVKKDTDTLQTIFSVMHDRTNHDFSGYKTNTMIRRIQRRMGVRLVNTLEEYLEIIRNDKDEVESLFKDLLIGVSSFFRDQKAWDELKKHVLPELLDRKENGTPIRVWIPGCSTGEEAYSLAIIIDEYCQEQRINCEVIIFATDIDKNALEFARKGIYSENQLVNVPANYVSRYFEVQGTQYRIKEHIRSAIVFSIQNIISDPPFSKLNMISCRNLLIYFDNDIQQKIIKLFYYALQPQGYLFLGTSESPGQSTKLFKPISKQWRLYIRSRSLTLNAVNIPALPGANDYSSTNKNEHKKLKQESIEEITFRELIKWFAPTAVCVNNDLDIVYYYGDTHNYLKVPRGVPTNNIYLLVQEGLSNLLRGMIHTLHNSNDEKVVRRGQMKRGADTIMVSVSVIRFSHNDITGYIITFEDVQREGGDPEKCFDEPQVAVIKQLEGELKSTREDLQNTIEELETSNEELKSSNEKVMSMNEELQTSNEELETSKEELQSLNEELSTVNVELQDKLLELEHSNNDLKNIYAGTQIPILILDKNLRIKRISPSISELINLTEGDIGRPITDFTSKFIESTIIEDTQSVIRSLSTVERFVRTESNQYYIQRVIPYHTEQDKVDGAIITFSEYTSLYDAEKQMHFQASLIQRVGDAVIATDFDGVIKFWNESATALYGWTAEQVIGRNLFDLITAPHLNKEGSTFDTLFRKEALWQGELELQRKNGNVFWAEMDNRPYFDEHDNLCGIISVSRDISERKSNEQAIDKTRSMMERQSRTFNEMLSSIKDYLYIFDLNARFVFANKRLLELWGITSEEAVGKSMVDLDYPQEVEKVLREGIGRVIETGDVVVNETYYTSPTGTSGYFENILVPMLDADGNVIEIAGSSREVTDQKKHQDILRASEERFRSLFNNMTEGFALHEIITDEKDTPINYRFLEINPAFEKLTGLKRDQLLGKTVLEVLPGTESHWIDNYGKVALTGKPKQFENYSVSLQRWYEVYAYQPVPRQFAVLFNDITDRKQTETALRESEGRMKRAQEIAHLGSWDLDLISDKLTWSDEVYHIFGLLPQEYEATYEAFLEHVHPEDRRAVDEAYTNSIKEGRDTYEIEHRIIQNGSGEIRFVLERCVHFYDDAGSIIRSSGMVLDITERKLTEDALRESRQDLAHAQEVGNIGSWRMDVRINRLYWSDQNYHVFGVPLGAELSYNTFLETIHPDDREFVDREWNAALKGKPYDIEHRIIRYGEIRWLRERAVIEFDDEGRLKGGFGTSQDITTRKLAEEALRESEERFRMVLENSLDGISLADVSNHKYVFVSKSLSSITGFKCDELLEMTALQKDSRIHPDDREKMQNYYSHVLKGDGFMGALEYRWQVKSGKYRWISVSINAIRDMSGKPLFLVGITRDIHEKKRMQEKIIQNEILLSKTLEQFPGIISLWDMKHRLLFANNQWRMIYNIRGRVEGKPLSTVYNTNDYNDIAMAFEQTAELHEVQTLKTKHKAPRGEVIYLRRFMPLGSGSGEDEVIVDIGQEVTEYENTRSTLEIIRDRLEQQVTLSTKELQEMNQELNVSNTALNKLIEGYKNHEKEAQQRIIKGLDTLVLPYLRDLELATRDKEQIRLLDIIRTSINEITLEFGSNLETLGRKLSPTEIKVANLIRNNYETNDIAEILHMEMNTVFSHRRRIRKKLGLSGKDKNLKTYLMSLDEK